MVFSSMTFLCVFLPTVFLLYYLLPSLQIKNGLLIIASLLFYAYGEPVYVLLMLVSIVMNYLFGLMLAADRSVKFKRWTVGISVVANLSLLFVFKYMDMMIETVNRLTGENIPTTNLALPIGISFFTFQAMSYVIDVYRGTVRAEKNVFHVMLYISFFPQLIAGPIVKYHDIAEEIRNRKVDSTRVAEGFRRFIVGLSKKVLISNTMGQTADVLFAVPAGNLNALAAWMGAIAYLFQIYFDFSGYSDMAIGLGHMFGFHFQENFRYPYMSKSIQEFWRRWHISLSTWFKEYLYIPLGGNRKGKLRTSINKVIVFFSTGLWHGASWTFVVWGLWHGLFMLIEEWIPIKKLPGWLRHIYAMLVVVVGFVMFRAETFAQGIAIIGKMFTGWTFDAPAMQIVIGQLTPLFLVTLLCAVIGSSDIWKRIFAWCENRPMRKKIYTTSGFAISILLLLLCMASLAGGTYNPFIYFRF